MPSVVVRINCEPLDGQREEFLKNVFGADAVVLDRKVSFGGRPENDVRSLLNRVASECGCEVAVIEVQAPSAVLATLVNNGGFRLIRAQLKRDDAGRIVIIGSDASGRDVVRFSHYEELVETEFKTRQLE